jgi:hypothetical protein
LLDRRDREDADGLALGRKMTVDEAVYGPRIPHQRLQQPMLIATVGERGEHEQIAEEQQQQHAHPRQGDTDDFPTHAATWLSLTAGWRRHGVV